MGSYSHLRGTIKFKSELIDKLKDRFTYKPGSEEPLARWGDLDLPSEIKESKLFKIQVNQDAKCQGSLVGFIPGSMVCASWGFEKDYSRIPEDTEFEERPKAVMNFSTVTGELVFECSTRDWFQEIMYGFILLMPLMAISWKIEYDDQQLSDAGDWLSFTPDTSLKELERLKQVIRHHGLDLD